MRPAPTSALVALLQDERRYLEQRLLETGALLFRGFEVAGGPDLARVVAARRAPVRTYVGGDSPRRLVEGGVYTSTDCPPHVPLALHNEMSYLPSYPQHLFFHCTVPPPHGGETTLADGAAVLARLEPSVRQRFRRHGVRYQLSFRGPGGFYAALDRVQKVTRSWHEAFETEEKAEVESRLASWNARHRWLPGERLVIETVQPAERAHPLTGQAVWFNQAHLFRLSPRVLGWTRFLLSRLVMPLPELRPHAWFGDGGEIGDQDLDQVMNALEACTAPVKWQRGDVLWVDNLRCLHGRRPFHGARQVLVALTDE
jgi:alpha-ketoglutarate-dependent taurine dioxygenase